jgi:hypothetical protein
LVSGVLLVASFVFAPCYLTPNSSRRSTARSSAN